MKDKVADARHAVADAAENVGHKIAEGAEKSGRFPVSPYNRCVVVG
jgi:hypothetical protein